MSAVLKRRCHCGSLECGPVRCRFADPAATRHDDEVREIEVDERVEELREFDRFPERYR